MKNFINSILLLVTWLFGNLALGWQTPSRELEELEEKAFQQAVTQVAPSLVRIETVGGLDQIQNFTVGSGPTTGVVVSADGYVISSSFNFVSKPTSILVSLTDGRRLPAKLVANDVARMLTLLKIEATGLVPAKAAPKNIINSSVPYFLLYMVCLLFYPVFFYVSGRLCWGALVAGYYPY